MKSKLVLSLYPGLGGLCRGFTRAGFTVAKGPDKLLGERIEDFHGIKGRFDGVIGGSPCQPYSGLNRTAKRKTEDPGLFNFRRVVSECQPEFWLHENVVGVPEFQIEGYKAQRFHIDLSSFRDASRLRVFTFGHKGGRLLNPIKSESRAGLEPCALTTDSRPWDVLRDIQGFEPDLTLKGFTDAGKKRLIANAVPVPMAEYVADLIKRDIYGKTPRMTDLLGDPVRRCACGCGRAVYGRSKTYDGACRMRVCRKRRNNAAKPAL